MQWTTDKLFVNILNHWQTNLVWDFQKQDIATGVKQGDYGNEIEWIEKAEGKMCGCLRKNYKNDKGVTQSVIRRAASE